MYPMILDLADDGVPVTVTCRVLEFSTQAICKWRKAPVSQRDWDDAHLINAARDIHADDPAFGYRFIADELPGRGISAGENRVAQLCSQERIWSIFAKKRGLNRRSGPPVHDDLVQRQFSAAGPNHLWLTDITERRTDEGKLYLCAIKDVYSNRIVGYSIDSRMKSSLAVAALHHAVALRSPVATIVHSDRGSQFRSRKFVYALSHNGLHGSMGLVGACGDNAAMESFFALLQRNVLDRKRWTTRTELRLAIVSWIERTYHRQRRQRTLGRLPPIEFELLHTPDCVAPYLVELTTEEQKRRWLPKFCSGELISAIAMTEPSGGSDLAALNTTAVKDGSSYVINGSKTFITNGFQADLVIVAARTTPKRKSKGITLFAVEAATPGFTRGRKLDKVGQPEADTAELFFDNVRVERSNIIGEVDQGFIHMMKMLPRERISCGIANLAHTRRILEETVAYAQQRKAFGQSIGSMQWNKFLLAEMVTKLDVAQAFVDECVAVHMTGDLNAVDAAKAKFWSSEIQNEILDHCVQIHGGYGFMNEYRVARAWKDARVTKIWAGSNEIVREVISRELAL